MSVYEFVAAFERDGFVVLPGVLDAGVVAEVNGAIERDLAGHPAEWAHFSDSFIQAVDLLPRCGEFDGLIEHPAVLELLERLLGPDVTFEELSVILRNPTREGSDHKSWHRDIVRDYERRFEIRAISAVYYLTDVTERDHCFSIIPGTHDRRAGMRPEDVEPGMEVDLLAPAGSVILFHARCLHSGKLKPESRQRRTVHLYYSKAGLPRTSEWSSMPERLRGPLYAKAGRPDVMEGTGRKPRGLAAGLPLLEVLREAQRRAALA